MCSLVEVNLHFKGTCHLHLQDWKLSHARNQHEVKLCFLLASWLAYSSTMKEVICSSETLTFTRLHSIMSCKTELFIVTAVRNSNPAIKCQLVFISYIVNITSVHIEEKKPKLESYLTFLNYMILLTVWRGKVSHLLEGNDSNLGPGMDHKSSDYI